VDIPLFSYHDKGFAILSSSNQGAEKLYPPLNVMVNRTSRTAYSMKEEGGLFVPHQ
jgi:hypothetical protein